MYNAYQRTSRKVANVGSIVNILLPGKILLGVLVEDYYIKKCVTLKFKVKLLFSVKLRKLAYNIRDNIVVFEMMH